jgi:predicted DNA-binding transcriptional regulator AlpA
LRSANERPRLGTEGAARNTNDNYRTTPARPAPASIEAVVDPHREAALSFAKPSQTLTAAIEPLLSITDLVQILNVSRRAVERMRSAGKLPPPDLHVGRMPRWKAATIRAWIGKGGRP